MESLKISVSSVHTVTTEQQIGEMEVTTEQGMEMEAELQEAMVESGKKSSESGESSDMVRVEMTSDTTSSDIEVIRRNSEVSGGHTRNSSDQSSLGQLEVDSVEDLRRRNKELSEILAAREGRLVAVSREIIQVQEESGDLAVRLQGAVEQLQGERSRNQDLEQRTKV